MAPDTRILGGGSRWIRSLRRHFGLSGDGAADGPAVAALDELERAEQRCLSADPRKRVQPLLLDYSQYVCGRSEFSRWLRADLAVGRAERPARRAADDCNLSRDQGDTGMAGVSAEYLSNRRHESVSGMSRGLCVSRLERQLDARGRQPSVAAEA